MTTAQQSPTARYLKILRILAYIALGILIFLSLLPIGIRYAAQYSLYKLGAEEAYIEDVDLNLFTGSFALKGVQVYMADQPTLVLEQLRLTIDIKSLLKKQLLIESLLVQGFDLSIYQQNEQWVVAIPLPELEKEDGPEELIDEEESEWRVGVQSIQLDQFVVRARYMEQDFNLELHELLLSELLMWAPEQRSPFVLRGAINQAPILINSELEPFSETPFFAFDLQLQQLDLSALKTFLPENIDDFAAKLSIDTKVQVGFDAQGNIDLSQEGELKVSDIQLTMEQLQALLDDVAWQGKLNVQLDSKQQLKLLADGVANIVLQSLQLDEVQAKAGDVRWQGLLNLAMDDKQNVDVGTTGKIFLKDLSAVYQPFLLATSLEQFEWSGEANINSSDIEQSLQVSGNLHLEQWNLQDQQMASSLASFDNLAIESLHVDGMSNIAIEQVNLTQLQGLKTADHPLASIDAIQLLTLQLEHQNQLAIEQVNVDNIAAHLVRNQHGNIAVIDDWLVELSQRLAVQEQAKPVSGSEDSLEQNQLEANDSTASLEANAQDFHYRIQSIQIQGDKAIVFADRGVEPEVKHQLVLEKLAIGPIDSRNLDDKTLLDVYLRLYQHGRLTVNGYLTPLQDIAMMNGDLKAEVKGIELTDISPYLEENIGYQARSGQFNSETTAKLQRGQIKSNTKVRVQRIDLKPQDEEAMARVSKSIAMPISTAIKVITDKKNTLKIDVPVKGDLSHPDVKINKIMSAAITQAVKNTAMTYFKFAVQPFGAIVMVSQAIGNAKLQARFEDVRFMPGTADMVDEQKGYLAKVAQMIKEKKDFSVVACVYVTDEDFLARKRPPKLAEKESYQWDDESKALAQERLELIRGSLIQQHGLDSDQIQSCKAQLGKGTPRAVMGI